MRLRNYLVFLPLLLTVICGGALAQDVSADYVQGPGGYYRKDDRSGPYSVAPGGAATLLGALSPVSSPVDAVRASRLYTASTGFITVSAGNVLNAVLANPAGSGKNIIILGRRFASTATAALAYRGINTPTAGTFSSPAPTTRVPSPSDGAPNTAAVATFRFNMSATAIDSSPSTTAPAGGILSPTSEETLDFVRRIKPGQSFGNYIGGAGGLLTADAVLSITYYWIEEPAT